MVRSTQTVLFTKRIIWPILTFIRRPFDTIGFRFRICRALSEFAIGWPMRENRAVENCQISLLAHCAFDVFFLKFGDAICVCVGGGDL